MAMWKGLCTSGCCGQILHLCVAVVMDGLAVCVWGGLILHISVAVVMDVLAQGVGDSTHQRGHGHGCAGNIRLCTFLSQLIH